jgi:predicted DNA-binding ribbon-helix-helix protein
VKRSIAIAGHRTSVSLEPAFWLRLREIAEQRGATVAALVAEIDAQRSGTNLSSAIRVFLLEEALAARSETEDESLTLPLRASGERGDRRSD